MTPEQIAALREALPKAQQYLRSLDHYPLLRDTSGGRGLVRCRPIVDAMPALLDELERLQRELDDCTRSHQKQNAVADGALDILCDLEQGIEKGEIPFPPGLLRERIRAFLDSE